MTIHSSALRSAVTFLAAATPLVAQTSTQPEIVACFDSRTSSSGVPVGSGIVYRIKVSGVVGQQGCVDPRHTQFSWTIQHGALTGLDVDDHKQYLLVNGARPLTGTLTLSPGSGNALVITAGNVGIGTATPASKLTVAGTIESASGGFKFPDGTVQTTAAAGGGSGLAGYEIVNATRTWPLDQLGVIQFNAIAFCPSGKVPIAGGFSIFSMRPDDALTLFGNGPVGLPGPGQPQGWGSQGFIRPPVPIPTESREVQASVICVAG